ncbi:hypothetical protein RG903_10765 [Thermithiobacillus tepidarius DSM 3134]|uniref:hypothetical protein n=1 Tax=Thermithiobacillus tepidarius TaxID=929 RepID=UPI0004042F46|nr:hypothetical protein [Thermithiobacillus tepidarius]
MEFKPHAFQALLFLPLLALFPLSAQALNAPDPIPTSVYQGKLKAVFTGDTFRLSVQGGPVELPLAVVDAPDYARDAGAPTKRASALDFGKGADVARQQYDQFGRQANAELEAGTEALKNGVLSAGASLAAFSAPLLAGWNSHVGAASLWNDWSPASVWERYLKPAKVSLEQKVRGNSNRGHLYRHPLPAKLGLGGGS